MFKEYTEKTFNIGELEGLSKDQIDAHLGLYEGYVKNTNALLKDIERLKSTGTEDERAVSELTRRFGFEFNGMRLHEYYFEQFDQAATNDSEALKTALAEQYGSFEAWKEDIIRIAKMRGVGWALLVKDEREGNLHNIWVGDHELGQLGGQQILLALDVWEHAFLIDYKPSERGNYIEAFFKNLNWGVVEGRF